MDTLRLTSATITNVDITYGIAELRLEFTLRDTDYESLQEFDLESASEFADEVIERLHEIGGGLLYHQHQIAAPAIHLPAEDDLLEAFRSYHREHVPTAAIGGRKRFTEDLRDAIKGATIPLPEAITPAKSDEHFEIELARAHNQMRDQSWQSALERLKRLHNDYPDRFEIGCGIVECQLRLRQILDAHQALQEVVERGAVPPNDLLMRVLDRLRHLGRHNEADHLLEALELNAPNHVILRLEEAWRRYRSGKDPTLELKRLNREMPDLLKRYMRSQWRWVTSPRASTAYPMRELAMDLGIDTERLRNLARRQAIPARYQHKEDKFLFYREDITDWLRFNEELELELY